ncbi:MAG: zf-HC2 domain-containing protein [Elusimicrobiota bacterium]
MICLMLENIWDLYADGRLAPSQARWVRGHAETCPRCREEAAAWQGMLETLPSLDEAPAPEGLKAALARPGREAAAKRPETELWPEWSWTESPSMALALGVSAALLGLSLIGPGVISQSCSQQDQIVCPLPISGSQGGIR